MKANMESIPHPPNAGRTILGLRDTGYTLYTAVADIVDNSINSRADNVWIDIHLDPADHVHFRIADDGYGMDPEELRTAMTYGSPVREDGNELGRFGLGLKTASSSVCRRLTVLSRSSSDADVMAARWDLDYVNEHSDWLLQYGRPGDELLSDYYERIESIGTLVCWDKVDRLGTESSGGRDNTYSSQSLAQYRRHLREHLALVFHRFIEREDVCIRLNGKAIEPWDPFVRAEDTELKLERTYRVEHPNVDGSHEVDLRAYVIPNKYEYSSEEAYEEARVANARQGFYVYREDRVIISADTLGMWAKEPHYSLLRIELAFPRELDHLFNLDIKKSQMELNPQLKEEIERRIAPVRKVANTRYREGRKRSVDERGEEESPHSQSQGMIDHKYEETTSKVKPKKIAENRVEITNVDGKTIIDMPTSEGAEIGEVIELVDSLQDGLFWEPILTNNRIGVRINRSHLYYDRVYVPNFDNSVTVSGIDSILWALAKCEMEVLNDVNRKKLEELRYQTSRTLRQLAEEIPESEVEG